METLVIDSYTVWGGSPLEDLFSVALRFIPIASPVPDKVGLGKAIPKSDDECRIAIEVIEQIIKRRNVDEILRSDPELYESTVKEKAILLQAAGFDIGRYVTYVKDVLRLPEPEFSRP